MPSSLTWLDHDAAAQARSATLLALLDQPGTRDELGFGGIRDALSDQLFPGTSVIQTRLRYMLLLPRMFMGLEASSVRPRDFAERARQDELKLNDCLAAEDGAFGRDSGHTLKRLASSVYWAGMRSWGIFARSGSQQDYFSAIEQIRRERSWKQQRDDGMEDAELIAQTWHPSLEKLVPVAALEEGSLSLTADEAEFIREQWKVHHPQTLLVWLAQDKGRLGDCADAGFPWLHPQIRQAPQLLRELVEHARQFSRLANGASLVYNLALAEASSNDERREEYGQELKTWIDGVPASQLGEWDMVQFWEQVERVGRPIHPRTREFVSSWLALVKAGQADSPQSRSLVRERERSLKGNLSRFNPENLDRWSGASGLGILNYRWGITRRHLADLLHGLEAA
ncbi:TPA: hypothetical protein UOA81_003710 [Stenotrophomonas maltophilia]|uniref:DUF6361 family protein n=1 Tax=Stenotrophomonas maltophilia TaxID=40324 RepID=UPI000F778B22|nr:DUF6361 family protein [Stenotrophomonas maltophilia]RRU79789.1 hypothetical protein EGJ24_13755 [Stenotrophomonas maltophilia]HEL5028475.1 hypothetical protein [Stenotrophomonas maltophilia]